MRRDPKQLAEREFDCLVVGGGIYGAALGWEAAACGLSVAVIEKGDFGQETSANSQRIIHGGLRYLAAGEIRRARMSVRERQTWLALAPHLVRPQPFLVPAWSRSFHAALALGLWVGDRIVWDCNRGIVDPVQRIPPSRMIGAADCRRIAPGLEGRALTGGALWYDAVASSSERLTLSFVLSAAEAGAAVANRVEAKRLLWRGERVVGAAVVDRLTGDELAIRAKVVVNACGPWRAELATERGAPIDRHVKAINVLTRPVVDGVGLGVGSRRQQRRTAGLLFFLPWRGRTLIGTTYHRDDGTSSAREEEVAALIADANDAYPAARLCLDDVELVHVGRLPARRDGQALDRRGQVIDEARRSGVDGLLSVQGVKYTEARFLAAHAVHLAFGKLGFARPSAATSRALYGGAIDDLGRFLERAIEERPAGIGAAAVRELVSAYGSRVPDVVNCVRADPSLGAPIASSWPLPQAAVVHSVREEMAHSLADVLLRRTAIGSAGWPGAECVRAVAELMARHCGWSAARTEEEIASVSTLYERAWARCRDTPSADSVAEARGPKTRGTMGVGGGEGMRNAG